MRRLSMFLPVLCCLALVAQAVRGSKRAEGAGQEQGMDGGFSLERNKEEPTPQRQRDTQDVTATITKRHDKSFEGLFAMNRGTGCLDWEGDVDAAGQMKHPITKIAKAPEELK